MFGVVTSGLGDIGMNSAQTVFDVGNVTDSYNVSINGNWNNSTKMFEMGSLSIRVAGQTLRYGIAQLTPLQLHQLPKKTLILFLYTF
ncbi:MAG: hypothetical protein U9N43_09845 [Euryarchaeota archaeon]|nr:hypothetical protein [Euryarchaeota archaeon]